MYVLWKVLLMKDIYLFGFGAEKEEIKSSPLFKRKQLGTWLLLLACQFCFQKAFLYMAH